MGGLTYLFGFILNGVTATVLAGLAALVAALVRRAAKTEGNYDGIARRMPGAAVTFVCVWLLLML